MTEVSIEPISLAEQIACLERELALRRHVYPKWVEAGRLKDEQAKMEIARMAAALNTLCALEVESRPLDPQPRTLNELITPKQLWMMRALGMEKGVDVEVESRRRFGLGIEEINKAAASAIITYLRRLD